MAEPTNPQAALQAAATVYSGGRGYSSGQVMTLANDFLEWLEDADAQEAQRPASPLLKAAADGIR